MSFEDFCKHYRTIDYCKLVNLPGWKSYLLESSWLPNKGGRMGLPEKFPENPQFLLSTSSTSNCHISLVLSQQEIREDSINQVDFKSIYVFRLGDLQMSLPPSPSTSSSTGTSLKKIIQTPRQKSIYQRCDSFQNSRDISLEFQVTLVFLSSL